MGLLNNVRPVRRRSCARALGLTRRGSRPSTSWRAARNVAEGGELQYRAITRAAPVAIARSGGVVKDGPHKNRLAKVIDKSDGKNPWYTLKADDGNRIIKFRKHELRLLKSQISPRRRNPKRGAQDKAAESDSEEKEEDDAVEWLDVALRARLPGVPGFCEGKVIEHQEQETYLVEWSYPNPLSGEPVTFRQSAGVREMRKWKKPPA